MAVVVPLAFGGAVCNRGFFPIRQRICNMGHMTSHVRSVSNKRKEILCLVMYDASSESSSITDEMRLLESYFAKLQDDDAANQTSSDSSNKMTITELCHESGEINAKEELDSLDDYLGKLNQDANIGKYVSSTSSYQTTESNMVATPFSIIRNSKRGDGGKLRSYKNLKSSDGGIGLARSQASQQNDETSDLYAVSILGSVNIAVFLFDIASPIRNSEFELFSLPLLYGAKINELILVGEYWRLVTPMFLHSGLLHVALGCWMLLTFGPQVCKAYGSFTFFLIYTLGGISGNLASFLHTPEPTVGGTGPVFAIIGSWLIYQMQNKDVIAKDVSESMFQKAIIATTLSFIISNFGPVDNWTHFGAFFTGIAYGFFTCPMLQVDDSSSRTSQEEGITLVGQNADPIKSLFMFTIFVIVLSSLVLFIEPPLDTL